MHPFTTLLHNSPLQPPPQTPSTAFFNNPFRQPPQESPPTTSLNKHPPLPPSSLALPFLIWWEPGPVPLVFSSFQLKQSTRACWSGVYGATVFEHFSGQYGTHLRRLDSAGAIAQPARFSTVAAKCLTLFSGKPIRFCAADDVLTNPSAPSHLTARFSRGADDNRCANGCHMNLSTCVIRPFLSPSGSLNSVAACPSDVRNILLKHVENRYWKQWAEKNMLLSWQAAFGLSQYRPSPRRSVQRYGQEDMQRKRRRNCWFSSDQLCSVIRRALRVHNSFICSEQMFVCVVAHATRRMATCQPASVPDSQIPFPPLEDEQTQIHKLQHLSTRRATHCTIQRGLCIVALETRNEPSCVSNNPSVVRLYCVRSCMDTNIVRTCPGNCF